MHSEDPEMDGGWDIDFIVINQMVPVLHPR